jgi:GNAT superfamily N-acetyltransferase
MSYRLAVPVLDVNCLAMTVRGAESADTVALARLWHEGWQDAHSQILPEQLARARTLESFERRMAAALDDVRVIGPRESPLGFYMLKGEELYQFYVSAPARGAGVAAALMEDAEARLAKRGVEVAWLTCAIGNKRAARFYEKRGWNCAGPVVSELDTGDGIINLEVWRYEKRLSADLSEFSKR